MGKQRRQRRQAELVIAIGKAVVRVMAGEVVKGDSNHGVSKGGKVGKDMGRGGGRGGKEVIVGFLEAAVNVAAEVRMLQGAISVRLKEVGTSRTKQSALMTGVGLPGRKDILVGR